MVVLSDLEHEDDRSAEPDTNRLSNDVRADSGRNSRRALLQQGAAIGLGLVAFGTLERHAGASVANQLRTANILMQNGELAADQYVRLPEGEPTEPAEPDPQRGTAPAPAAPTTLQPPQRRS